MSVNDFKSSRLLQKKIPVINEFKDEDGNDIMQQQIDRNYSRIKADVLQIIEEEMARIANDPDLKHLIPHHEVHILAHCRTSDKDLLFPV